MKNLFGILIILCSLGTFGQSEPKELLSKAEKFSTQAGTLIKKEFLDIGSVNKAEIKVVRFTDLISMDSVSAVRFEYKVASSYSTDTKLASLDSDEIEGLITSLKTIQNRIFALSPETYTEVTYRSRGGFEAGCFWSKNAWSAYLKLEQFDGKSFVFLKKEDFPNLLSLLERAQQRL